MSKTKWVSAAVIVGTSLVASQAAMAYGAGDFFARGGFAKSNPESDNGRAGGEQIDVSDENGFTFGVGYLVHDKIGVELNSSEKIDHNVAVGGDSFGFDRQPVNLMVNYYPLGGLDSKVQPYVGAGLNYTRFSGEPSGIDLQKSYGAAGQVGIDLAITKNVSLNGFANYADVDSDIRQNGSTIGRADVDPVTVGGGVTLHF